MCNIALIPIYSHFATGFVTDKLHNMFFPTTLSSHLTLTQCAQIRQTKDPFDGSRESQKNVRPRRRRTSSGVEPERVMNLPSNRAFGPTDPRTMLVHNGEVNAIDFLSVLLPKRDADGIVCDFRPMGATPMAPSQMGRLRRSVQRVATAAVHGGSLYLIQSNQIMPLDGIIVIDSVKLGNPTRVREPSLYRFESDRFC